MMIRPSPFFAAFLLLLSVSPSPVSRRRSEPTYGFLNANHLFNTIHDSMRQFGSSLHHNGMSYLIATVPAGTHLYHGGDDGAKPVEGPEWLAFEPEHALLFTSQPPRPPNKEPPRHIEQQIFGAKRQRRHNGGYLRTYAAKHDLRLLYIDGQSAAKSGLGTLDTQDYILVNHTSDRGPGGLGERPRAAQMCQRAAKQWKGQIDGILRMEGGFEVILCSFKDGLTPLRKATIPGDDSEMFRNADEYFNYYQSVISRYDGIGGHRVQIDYDNFVSAYTFAEADLFQYGSKPRLNGTNAAVIQAIREQLDELASEPRRCSAARHDWQSVTDMIVARHAPRLLYATSPAMSSYDVLASELDRMMKPFIDYEGRSYEEEVQRCTDEYIPAGWPMDSTAGQAVRTVSRRICLTFADLMRTNEVKDKTLTFATKQLNDLINWLDWSTWKKCTGCLADEVCVVPMWPRGDLSDWEHPTCANKTVAFQRHGYWGPIPKF